MKAGAELDQLIATKVMGWKQNVSVWNNNRLSWYGEELFRPIPVDEFSPSENMNDAWAVVEKLIKERYMFKLSQSLEGHWYADFNDIRVYKESAPHAICIAALMAVGVEVEDETTEI